MHGWHDGIIGSRCAGRVWRTGDACEVWDRGVAWQVAVAHFFLLSSKKKKKRQQRAVWRRRRIKNNINYSRECRALKDGEHFGWQQSRSQHFATPSLHNYIEQRGISWSLYSGSWESGGWGLRGRAPMNKKKFQVMSFLLRRFTFPADQSQKLSPRRSQVIKRSVLLGIFKEAKHSFGGSSSSLDPSQSVPSLFFFPPFYVRRASKNPTVNPAAVRRRRKQTPIPNPFSLVIIPQFKRSYLNPERTTRPSPRSQNKPLLSQTIFAEGGVWCGGVTLRTRRSLAHLVLSQTGEYIISKVHGSTKTAGSSD